MKLRILVAALGGLLVLGGAAQAAGVLDSGSADPAEAKEQRVLDAFGNRTSDASASAQRRGPKGSRGPRGAQGPQGPQGVPGPKGTFGAVTSISGPSVFLCGWESGSCSVSSSVVACPPGTTVISGGYSGAGIRAFIDAPIPGGWFVGAANESSFSTTFKAFALCAS